jgi:hypothetical protein
MAKNTEGGNVLMSSVLLSTSAFLKGSKKGCFSSANASLGKKGYMITPIIFIAFLLISVAFSFYVSDIDTRFSDSIVTSSMISKSIDSIYEKQLDQINLAKLYAYSCSANYCYPNKTVALVSCVNSNMTVRYGNQTGGWNTIIYNQSSKYYINITLNSFNATNINMTSERITISRTLINATGYLNTSC